MIEETTQSNHSGEAEVMNKDLNGLYDPSEIVSLGVSKEYRPCSICVVPLLASPCSTASCPRTVHLHCIQRFFPEAVSPEGGLSCDLHCRKGNKAREHSKLLLVRSVAQRISTQDQILTQLKKVDQKSHHWATGNVFWYVLNHQFFPKVASLATHPNFQTLPVTCEASDSVEETIEKLQAELDVLNQTNEGFWNELRQQLPPVMCHKPRREDECILNEIMDFSLKPASDAYLNHLEQQLKHVHEPIAETAQKSTNQRGVLQDEEDFKCSVCGDGDYEDDDLIVICSKCEMAAHMKCYGITHLPDHDWFCEPCQHYEKLEDRIRVRCALCTVKGGGLKQTIHRTSAECAWPNYPFTGVSEIVWCHVFCAFHVDPNSIKDAVNITNIDLTCIDSKRFTMKCQICHTKDGACIQCQFRRCQSSFHPECGKHLFVNTRDKTGYDEVRIYCLEHKPLNLRRVLAVREKRTVEEITTFSRLVEKLSKKKRKPTAPKPVEDNGFSYKDKFELFELAEKYLEVVQRTQTDCFRIYMKKNNSLTKLRNKTEVSRPSKFNAMDPYSIFTKGFKVSKKRAETFFHFYDSEVYPIMKNEVIHLKQDVVVYKPKRKRKINKKELAQGYKRSKLMPPPYIPVKESAELYCFCRKPFVENALQFIGESDEAFRLRTQGNAMIGCDYCDGWYHYTCVGLSFDYAESPWKCPKCQEASN